MLHLNRFTAHDVSQGFVWQKNEAPIEFPSTLKLDPIFKETHQGYHHVSEETRVPVPDYTLKMIVHHHGVQMGKKRKENTKGPTTGYYGYYTVDALRLVSDSPNEASELWVEFDNNTVRPTNLQSILDDEEKKKTAYLLVYTNDGSDDECQES